MANQFYEIGSSIATWDLKGKISIAELKSPQNRTFQDYVKQVKSDKVGSFNGLQIFPKIE